MMGLYWLFEKTIGTSDDFMAQECVRKSKNVLGKRCFLAAIIKIIRVFLLE